MGELNMSKESGRSALYDQQEWFRVTLASIGDAVITTDTKGRVTFINPIAQELTGWTLDEAVGKPLDSVFKIVCEGTRAEVESPVTKALREGLVVGLANHTLLVARNGTEHPIDDSAAPIRSEAGEILGVVLVFRDITERRKAELALSQSEERFRLLVEGTHDYAIFMLDKDGHVTSWNHGAERIKGYRADEIIGKHFSIFYPKEANDRNWPKTELRLAVAEGRFEDLGWRVRKDGSQFWANVVITALKDEVGNLRGFSKITRDLTERQKLERAKLQAEVMAELNRRKDEFLAMLSHELRNPLSAITNSLHLQRLRGNEDSLQQQARAVIERQVEQLARLVDDLLDVSRITSGRIRLRKEVVDLRGIVDRGVESVTPLVERRQHELRVTSPPEAVWVHVDPIRIEQVVANLLGNAIKYTEDRGRISVTIQREGQEAVLRVRDNGVGITPDLLPRVFDLFTQSDQTLDRSEGGLGVGLTVVQRLVELHGGRVGVASPGVGHGAEFMIRLPAAEPPADKKAPPTEKTATASPRALRVMVVDDNEDTADTTGLLLRQLGHDIRVYYASEPALQEASVFCPDVVFLDIGLPGINGYEAARQFRQNLIDKNLRLIAVSGYGLEADRQNSQAAGFDEHLIKPVEPRKLQEVLAKSRTAYQP